jgi:hypothetical protein
MAGGSAGRVSVGLGQKLYQSSNIGGGEKKNQLPGSGVDGSSGARLRERKEWSRGKGESGC